MALVILEEREIQTQRMLRLSASQRALLTCHKVLSEAAAVLAHAGSGTVVF